MLAQKILVAHTVWWIEGWIYENGPPPLKLLASQSNDLWLVPVCWCWFVPLSIISQLIQIATSNMWRFCFITILIKQYDFCVKVIDLDLNRLREQEKKWLQVCRWAIMYVSHLNHAPLATTCRHSAGARTTHVTFFQRLYKNRTEFKAWNDSVNCNRTWIRYESLP